MKRFIFNEQTICTYSIMVEAESEEAAEALLINNEISLTEYFCEESVNNSCESWIEEVSRDEFNDYVYPLLKKDGSIVNQLI